MVLLFEYGLKLTLMGMMRLGRKEKKGEIEDSPFFGVWR
jgi:hypothetical protein